MLFLKKKIIHPLLLGENKLNQTSICIFTNANVIRLITDNMKWILKKKKSNLLIK